MRLTLLPALAAGLLAATPVLAQTAATTTAAPTSAPTTIPATTAAPGGTHRDMMVERRITELHSKLKITATEQKPFDDFAQAMRDNATRMDDMVAKRRAAVGSATAVDQMKAYADMAQAHAEEVQHLVPAFSTMYASLSPEQKKLADQSFREFSGGPGGRRAKG